MGTWHYIIYLWFGHFALYNLFIYALIDALNDTGLEGLQLIIILMQTVGRFEVWVVPYRVRSKVLWVDIFQETKNSIS